MTTGSGLSPTTMKDQEPEGSVLCCWSYRQSSCPFLFYVIGPEKTSSLDVTARKSLSLSFFTIGTSSARRKKEERKDFLMAVTGISLQHFLDKKEKVNNGRSFYFFSFYVIVH